MKKGIAFFDFDGTITTRDTMLELVKHHSGTLRYLTGMLAISPYLVAMKLKFISNTAAKEKMLAHFFGSMPVEEFDSITRRFSNKILPSLIRPAAASALQQLKKDGVTIVIVSASARQWIGHWCEANGFQLLSSELEIKDGRVTGKLVGKNCHGTEKVRRIREQYKLTDFDTVLCYGDTSGDKPMLELATEAHYKPFRN